MTYEPSKFALPEGLAPDELASLGWYPGTEADQPMGMVDGVELHRHPVAIVRDLDPACGEMIDRWVAYGPDLSQANYEHEWSAWQVEAWLTMRGAHNREQLRRLDPKGGK